MNQLFVEVGLPLLHCVTGVILFWTFNQVLLFFYVSLTCIQSSYPEIIPRFYPGESLDAFFIWVWDAPKSKSALYTGGSLGHPPGVGDFSKKSNLKSKTVSEK